MKKILSIGLSNFSSPDIENYQTINNLPSLFDYEIVIVNPCNVIPVEYAYSPWKSVEITNLIGYNYIKNLDRMKKDAAYLLQKGGTIICLVTPIMNSVFYTQYDLTSRNNYSWTPIKYEDDSSSIIEQGSGREFKDIKKSYFEQYIKNDSIWNGYFDNSTNFTCDSKFYDLFKLNDDEFVFESTVLAKNKADKPVAILIKSGNGQFVFLPWSNHKKMGDILLDCAIRSQYQIKEKNPPNWLSNYQIPDEINLIKDIENSKNRLQEIQEKIITLQKEFDKKTALKKLLYEQSTALENTVKLVFEELKIPMQKRGSKDWIAKIDGQEIIIEVTGQISSIDVTKLSQLIRYRLEEEEKSKEKKIAILIGNHFADIEPKKRKEPFTKETVDRAIVLSIGLLSTLELYNAMIEVRSGKISNKEIHKKLLSSSGIIKLV